MLPMPFDDFLGNRSILETVRSQLATGRLRHSMLFAGVAGIGKWTLAQFIAKASNCVQMQNDFCNNCPSCQRISENAHPDVKSVAPDGQFIKIDQVPDTSILILVTSRPNDLLPTIRSRCQMYRFAPLPPEDIERLLEGRTSYSLDERRLLAQIAGGSLGKALTVDASEYRMQRDEMLGLLEACSRNFLYANAAKAASGWLDKRKQVEFDPKTGILFTLLRDLFLLKAGAEPGSLTHSDILARLSPLSRTYSFNQLTGAARSLDHLEAGTRRNLNRGLAADQFILQLGGVALS
jgi:DNA polymerase-3 subunit delta'